jgi:translocation and assembly module TamB
MLREVHGSLHGAATLGGTLSAPQILANIGISEASLKAPDYGLDLNGITLRVTSDANSNIDAGLQLNSGEGNIALNASLTQAFLPTRSLSATLKGSRFTVLDMTGATAVLSPDLRLSYANSALSLSGLATLDGANVDLSQWVSQLSGSGAVNVSRDVVIVRRPDGEGGEINASEEIALNIDARLRLGDDVRLSGYGLEAQLAGELQVKQDPGRTLLAYGELSVPNGAYQAYGQRLDISGGRVLFFGNPTNPVLDLRASRKTDAAEVGLQLGGTLSRMQSELYSVPSLPENEILSLLVTGKSFNNINSQDSDALLSTIANFGIARSQGLTNAIGGKLGLDSVSVSNNGNLRNSSLGLGKYLTPKLLMRYEVGLFDRQTALSLSYLLTDRLRLEVKTGASQSVDLSYTVEKD